MKVRHKLNINLETKINKVPHQIGDNECEDIVYILLQMN